MARRGLSISGLSLESKYEAIMHFLRRGYRYFALHDTIVGIRPKWTLAISREHITNGGIFQEISCWEARIRAEEIEVNIVKLCVAWCGRKILRLRAILFTYCPYCQKTSWPTTNSTLIDELSFPTY
jgi:hypothetical protein